MNIRYGLHVHKRVYSLSLPEAMMMVSTICQNPESTRIAPPFQVQHLQ